MFNILSDSDFFWFTISGSLLFFAVMHFTVSCYFDDNKDKKKQIDDNFYKKNQSKLNQYTFVASEYKFSNTDSPKGFCSNKSFHLNDEKGLYDFQTYFADSSNSLLLFEGNRIGLFLNQAELDVLPSLSDSLKYNQPYGHCNEVLKSNEHCSVLNMNYVPSSKSWMLLSIPALLNVPTENDEDNSMYPTEMVNDAKSEWINHILDVIDIPYEDDEDYDNYDDDDDNEIKVENIEQNIDEIQDNNTQVSNNTSETQEVNVIPEPQEVNVISGPQL